MLYTTEKHFPPYRSCLEQNASRSDFKDGYLVSEQTQHFKHLLQFALRQAAEATLHWSRVRWLPVAKTRRFTLKVSSFKSNLGRSQWIREAF